MRQVRRVLPEFFPRHGGGTFPFALTLLGIETESTDDVLHSVCDPELPDAGEVWGGGGCQEWRVAGSG